MAPTVPGELINQIITNELWGCSWAVLASLVGIFNGLVFSLMGPPYWPRFCPMGFLNSPHSPKGGSEKSIALDHTGYGAIRRVDWGPLNHTFPAPYPPGSALSVENPCFGPWVQVPPSGPKKKVAKWRLNQRRGWPGGMPKGPWEPRGPWNQPN